MDWRWQVISVTEKFMPKFPPAFHRDQKTRHISRIVQGFLASPDHPILIDEYMVGRELEVDAVSDGTDVFIPGIMEQIERAGVHSGDSIAVYPPQHLSDEMVAQIVDYTTRITLELQVKGSVNIQFVAARDKLYIIEVNPRSSRTVPFLSKVTRIPMVEIATRIALGDTLKNMGYGTTTRPTPSCPRIAG